MLNYSVALRICHPSIDPKLITDVLGLEPSVSWPAGAPKATPRGTMVVGTRAETYWHREPLLLADEAQGDRCPEDVLSRAFHRLKPHAEFLLALRTSNARLNLTLSSYGSENYAFEFAPELMAGCASMGLSLVVDVYSLPQTSLTSTVA